MHARLYITLSAKRIREERKYILSVMIANQDFAERSKKRVVYSYIDFNAKPEMPTWVTSITIIKVSFRRTLAMLYSTDIDLCLKYII
jgi:hypothetical protein